jgi:hypothetical protein
VFRTTSHTPPDAAHIWAPNPVCDTGTHLFAIGSHVQTGMFCKQETGSVGACGVIPGMEIPGICGICGREAGHGNHSPIDFFTTE